MAIGLPGYVLIALRWRFQANPWESLYQLFGGFSYGMSLNAQFIGLTAAAPEDQRGSAIGLYYLSQQLGMIFGIGGFAALLEKTFRNNLRDVLRWIPEKDKVSSRLLYL